MRDVVDHGDGTVPALLASGSGTALAVPSAARGLTYDELHDLSLRIARQLAGAGVRPGSTVAAAVTNGPEAIVTFLGVLRAGAAFAPLNPVYTRQEFDAYLRDLEPAAMLFSAGEGDAAHAACAALGVPCHHLDAGSAEGDGIRGAAPAGALPPPDRERTALVLHTSGTTSAPKGVYLRHKNLVASMRTIAAGYGLGAEDVSYCVMPLFHVHGLVASTLAALASGGRVVVPPRFSASRFWPDVVANGATWFTAVPTIHRTLVLHAADHPLPREHGLRFARSCSSALAPSLWREFEQRLELPLVEAYGMTEASHQMASNPLPPGDRRPGTVGPATGVEVAILDDDWQPLPADAPGEVAIRGESVVDEYRGNPEATAASFRDGWFRTGDRGRVSTDGYLTLDGRIKELINRGGEKISPHEVEDVLLSHPQVAEAVAYAAIDEKYGEAVAAVVVAVDGTVDVEQLAQHCHERLAGFKVPTRISVAASIPRGPTGKVQRRRIAESIDP